MAIIFSISRLSSRSVLRVSWRSAWYPSSRSRARWASEMMWIRLTPKFKVRNLPPDLCDISFNLMKSANKRWDLIYPWKQQKKLERLRSQNFGRLFFRCCNRRCWWLWIEWIRVVAQLVEFLTFLSLLRFAPPASSSCCCCFVSFIAEQKGSLKVEEKS